MGMKPGSSKAGILFACSILFLAAVLCGYCFWPSSPNSEEVSMAADSGQSDNKGTAGSSSPNRAGGRTEEGADPGFVMVGGVRRKASDVQKPKPASTNRPVNQDRPNPAIDGYGKTPPVSPDANPNVKSVVEAIKEKKYPERLTPMVLPKPFDAAAFAKDPQAYLDIVEPGRAFAPAQPSKGVSRIKSISPYFQRVEQGGTVKLKTTGKPGMPVTFTSMDLGQFSNQLTSITVLANDQGIAEAEFVATPGTIEDVRIIAASPVTSGQTRFIVNVQLPRKTE